MATDLSPAEKDDRQAERLSPTGRKPPPSRKRREKRGPKHDNRRTVMKEDDPDAKAAARDRKASLADVALKIVFHGTGAASNEAPHDKSMAPKIATYHGTIQQGHPSGPTNTGYPSYDRRYFGKKEFDSIVSAAKGLLETDWLTHGWEGGVEDAPVRAALDLAISLADSSLYQSKIDAETYNMLLAKLSGSDIDLFSETLIEGGKSKRSAAVMSIKTIVQVANDLRKSNPRAAFELLKGVHGLKAAAVESHALAQGGPETPAAPDAPGGPSGGGEQTSMQSMSGSGSGLKADDLKKALDDMMSSKDSSDFSETLKRLKETWVRCEKLRGGERAPEGVLAARMASRFAADLEAIDDMSPEEINKILQTDGKAVDGIQQILQGLEDDAKADLSSASDEEWEALAAKMDELFDSLSEASSKSVASSVRITTSALLRIASTSPEAKALVLPLLAAAKKKMDKKKGKEGKKGKKGAPPAKKGAPPAKKGPGKKAPPFGGKKAPPFGKKKASINVTMDDASW